MMEPAKLKRWLIVIAIAYLLFPRDVIPDFLGRGLGLIDDLVLIGFLTYFYRRRLRDAPAGASQRGGGHAQQEQTRHERWEGREGRERAAPRRPGTTGGSPDPYEVLGVHRSASGDEIRAAYRARMQECHPDKVAHLGDELQSLAHRKAQEIQWAYEQLRR